MGRRDLKRGQQEARAQLTPVGISIDFKWGAPDPGTHPPMEVAYGLLMHGLAQIYVPRLPGVPSAMN